ncbi:energy transducer TonB [Tenacibaculum aestuarii]|uniref:energy transducer TonB n=1 Tax=Tenacibaculum aestuarii TaxID=362781 RepID=UPI0038958268
MKKIIIFLLAILYSTHLINAQEKCTSKDHDAKDINTIDKCLIEKQDDNQEESPLIVTTVSSRRYLKKRVYFEKVTRLAEKLKAKELHSLKIINELNSYHLSNLTPIIRKTEGKGVSFDIVDEIPMFLSCSDSSMDKTDCFNYEMQQHILNTLVYPDKALDEGIEGDVLVSFIIDETGKVTDIKTEGEGVHELLKEEAKRIVLLLPNFKPGKQAGTSSKVLYSFPMNFTLNTDVD